MAGDKRPVTIEVKLVDEQNYSLCEDVYWIWFQVIFGIGGRRAELMMDYFENPKQIYDGIKAQNRVVSMLNGDELNSCDACFERAREIERVSLKKGVSIVSQDHEDYPELLRQIYSRPAVLFVKGDLACLKGKLVIAMVGSRRHTEYGKEAAAFITRGLVRGDAVVVSGLAHGIDTECHSAAISSGGKSVGVLGCGIDVDYPKGNSKIKRLMSENGAVMTEYPLGTPPNTWNFPYRNRVISGISHGVVVVEGDINSGSLLTAHHAAEQGRDVFAVPGGIFSLRSKGVHRLIREGAKLTESAQDIFDEYAYIGLKKTVYESYKLSCNDDAGSAHKPMKDDDEENRVSTELLPQEIPKGTQRREPPPGLSETTLAVYETISTEAVTAEEIVAAVPEVKVADILSALTELEIYGLIQGYPGRKFGIVPGTDS